MNSEGPAPELDSETEFSVDSRDTKSEYDLFTPEDTESDEESEVIEEFNQVHELAKSLFETIENRGDELDFKQIILSESVNAIRTCNYMNVPEDKLRRHIENYFTLIEPFFEGEDFEGTKLGMLSEVCICLSLEELGFRLHETTLNDDSYGAIDILADTKDPEDPILAIQVRGHSWLEEPSVESLSSDTEDSGVQKSFATLSEKQHLKRERTAQKMRVWTEDPTFFKEHPELEGRDFLHLIISIPTGNEKDDIMSPIKTTGAPIGGFSKDLYEKYLEPIIWEE